MCMKMIITDEMIDAFNEIMLAEGSMYRLRRDKSTGNAIDIVHKPDIYADTENDRQVFVNKAFYEKLEAFFRAKGVWNISYNNTGRSFWKFA